MRVPSHVSSRGMAINMTPMIDVVFQLIVFFTATSTIAKNEFSQNLELPVAEKGKDRDLASQKKTIIANIAATGDVFLGGRRTNAQEFREILKAELAQHPADQLEVQFRADREALYAAVEPLLLACAREGVWQVSFAVKRPEQK
jgi:biopolymer transport protein ExbD